MTCRFQHEGVGFRPLAMSEEMISTLENPQISSFMASLTLTSELEPYQNPVRLGLGGAHGVRVLPEAVELEP